MKRNAFVAAGGALAATAALPAPLFAAPPATVRIGFLDSFSGVLSDIAGYHKIGANIALAEANARGRTKYEFVYGDDASKPAVGATEARRLVEQEKVDVMLFGTSSAVALAIMPLTLAANVFTVLIGPQDGSITSDHASLNTFRFAPNAAMFARVLGQRILASGKKWSFIVEDYAFGRDSYARLSALLKRAGGTEVGSDFTHVGTSDFSSIYTKIRNTDTEQVVLCQGGLDVALAAKQFVDFGLHKKMKLAGMTLEDFYYKTLPLDQLAGSVFAVIWTPTVSPSARALHAHLAKSIAGPISYRHYMSYLTAKQLIDRIEAAGTTHAAKLVAAFRDHSFDAAKADPAVWRGCDHQAAQNVYAGTVVNAKRFAQTQYLFDVVGETSAGESAGSCAGPDASAATAAMAKQTLPA
jgi:ABC-type branched-subunit amino acid transport system substrate-binding protein